MKKKMGFGLAVFLIIFLLRSSFVNHQNQTREMAILDVPERNFDVRLFFGYKDARPARFVADRYEGAIFLQKLIEPCSGGRQDCGFTPNFESTAGDLNTRIFYKIIHAKDGKHTKVSLRIFTSSVGADDNENRNNSFQKWKSDYLKDQFVLALKTADVVLYNGHSRAGGGPDFSPPELTKSKHVNYESYQNKKVGLSLIKTTLKQNLRSPLKILGLYSCESDQLFKKKIEAAKPSLKVIGSRQLLYFSDAFNESLEQLSHILEKINHT